MQKLEVLAMAFFALFFLIVRLSEHGPAGARNTKGDFIMITREEAVLFLSKLCEAPRVKCAVSTPSFHLWADGKLIRRGDHDAFLLRLR